MIDTLVGVRVKVGRFRDLVYNVANLPRPFRPAYFSLGGKIDKEASRIDAHYQFDAFVADRIAKLSWFDLIGERINFGFFTTETRTASNEPTHVGCSVVLRGTKWTTDDLAILLRSLCAVPDVERAYACRRAEWEYRHVSKTQLARLSIESTLGVDMSAFLPGLYWWTVFSEELAERHHLELRELTKFAPHYELWRDGAARILHAFRLYDTPDEWEKQKDRVSGFLEAHENFFSMTRIQPRFEETKSEAEFDTARRPYLAGSTPWEAAPPHDQE